MRELLTLVVVGSVVLVVAGACGRNDDAASHRVPARLIVFTGETLAVDMETGKIERVSGPLKDVYHVPSPDGRTLVIGCDDAGNALIGQDDVALCAYGPNGYTQLTNSDDLATPGLIEADGTILDVTWSPDGSRLAFLAKQRGVGGQLTSGDLYLLTLVSGDVRLLDQGSLVELRGPMKWSRDGTMLALRNSGRFGLRDGLLVIGVDAGFVDDLANPLAGDGGIEQYEWSPNGDSIALVRNEGAVLGSNLYAADVSYSGGGEVRRLTDAWGGTAPAWSPDGEWIAGTRSVNNFGRVFIVRSDGSDRRDMGEPLFRSDAPAWSPDGEKLAFVGAAAAAASPNEFPDSGLFVSEIDASMDPRLVSHLDPAFDPIIVFSPDGARIFFTADAAPCMEGCPPGYLYMVGVDGDESAARLHDQPVSSVLGIVYR